MIHSFPTRRSSYYNKADWFDKLLRTNIDVFHSWQGDVQRNISTVIDRTSTQYIRNACDAQVTGLELEATAIPWDVMEITGNLGLLDAHYDNGTSTDVQIGRASCREGVCQYE